MSFPSPTASYRMIEIGHYSVTVDFHNGDLVHSGVIRLIDSKWIFEAGSGSPLRDANGASHEDIEYLKALVERDLR